LVNKMKKSAPTPAPTPAVTPAPIAPAPAAITAHASERLACLRYGFSALLLFTVGGLSLEFLHLIKAPFYLENPLRRELWVLGHAHGGLLALLVLAYGAHVSNLPDAAAGRWLRWGAGLMPAGFLLGGVGNTEGDPSLLIFLTPLGAVLVILGLVGVVRGVWAD
jgi:hypothetical protein